MDYQEAVLALSQEELTPAEKRERLGALRDEIAQKHNGITWDTYKKRQETPALPVPKKPLAPEVKATAKRVYGDLPDKSFETINRDSLDLIAWGMSTKAGPDERNVPPIFNASWLARPQQADAEQPGIESLDKLRIFRQNANDPAQEAALRTDVLMRASVLEYQIEQGKGDFEKLKQQLSELQTNDQAPTIQQKTELIYHVNQLRELALIRSRAGYTPTDAKKQFGNEAWKHVPVFGSETELKKHGPAVLNFFGISDALKAQDFATTQKELIKQMRLNG